jgi:hypothetical protein
MSETLTSITVADLKATAEAVRRGLCRALIFCEGVYERKEMTPTARRQALRASLVALLDEAENLSCLLEPRSSLPPEQSEGAR